MTRTMFLCSGATCALMPQSVGLCASAHQSVCVPVGTCVHMCAAQGAWGWAVGGQAQLPHPMPAPSHPAGGAGDSPCQALPLARWAVTYLRLLF